MNDGVYTEMMKIGMKHHFIWLFIIIFFVTSMVTLQVVSFQWQQNTLEIEQKLAIKNTNIMGSFYTAYLEKLQVQTYEWGHWDDVYHQIPVMSEHLDLQKHPQFALRGEFNEDTIRNAGVDYVSIIDRYGDRVYRFVENDNKNFQTYIDNLMTTQNSSFRQRLNLLAFLPGRSNVFCGSHVVLNQLYFMCASNVSKNSNIHDSNGVIIVAKKFDEKQKSELENLIDGKIVYSAKLSKVFNQYPVHKLKFDDKTINYRFNKKYFVLSLETTDFFHETSGYVHAIYERNEIVNQNNKILEIYIILGSLLLTSLIFMYIFLKRLVIGPIEQLSKEVERKVNVKNWSVGIPNQYKYELKELTDNINILTEHLDDSMKVLENVALKDSLTGLYNRRYYDEKMLPWITNRIHDGKIVSYILCDVDNFKKFNDIYGHQEGDSILQTVSDILLSWGDANNATVCRLGGEEFVIVVEGEYKAHDLTLAMQTLFAQKAIEHIGNDPWMLLTISGGLCHVRWLADIETMYQNADIALYEAKRKGRNRVELCR